MACRARGLGEARALAGLEARDAECHSWSASPVWSGLRSLPKVRPTSCLVTSSRRCPVSINRRTMAPNGWATLLAARQMAAASSSDSTRSRLLWRSVAVRQTGCSASSRAPRRTDTTAPDETPRVAAPLCCESRGTRRVTHYSARSICLMMHGKISSTRLGSAAEKPIAPSVAASRFLVWCEVCAWQASGADKGF